MSGVICGAVIGGVIGFGGGLHGVSSGNRQLIKTFKKQMYYAQLNYNYNQAQLTKQQTSMYHNAMSQLSQLSYNAYLNNASVQAAQAQTGYEGRTSDAISRAISGQTLRQKTTIKDSYENAVANVRSQKDALYIEMKNNVDQAKDNLSNSFTHGFQAFMQVLQSTAMGAAAGYFGGAVVGAAGGAAGGTASGGVGAAAASSAGVDAISGAAYSATTAATAGSGSSALAGGVLGTTAVVSTGSLGASTRALSTTGSGFWNNFMAEYNTRLDKNPSLYNMFNNLNAFTSQYNRRGGNYY